MILPMFFALSGFLVSSSLARVPTIRFVALRFLRIFPALAVEVFISALIIGPLLTTYTLYAYFSDEKFIVYFKNLYGNIQYLLPGVFLTNPFPEIVNGPLWTVPFELECYFVLTALALVGIFRSKLLLAVAVGLMAILVSVSVPSYNPVASPIHGRMLVIYFLFGVLYFVFRDFIKLKVSLFVVFFVLSVIFVLNKSLVYLSPFTIAYCAVWIGLLNPNGIRLPGDYSYGIYLYGCPVQQAIVYLLPRDMVHWYVLAPLSFAIVPVFAALSWHYVERPLLSLRGYVRGSSLSGTQQPSKQDDAQSAGDTPSCPQQDRLA